MNKKIKIIVITIIAAIVGYYGYGFYSIFAKSHSGDWLTGKKYLWLFKDSIKNEINNPATFNTPYSWKKDKDVYNVFHYKDQYGIIVWEFKDLSLLNLKNTPINQNMPLDEVKFTSYEKLEPHGNPEIIIPYDMVFENKLKVNLDYKSKIIKNIESKNYKGFYGVINRMTFRDENNNDLVLFDYPKGPQATLFLLYKANNSFYVIMVQSEACNENAIKIFNLK